MGKRRGSFASSGREITIELLLDFPSYLPEPKSDSRHFYTGHRADHKLDTWYSEAAGASWKSSATLKAQYGSASIVSSERVVFNIVAGQVQRSLKETP